MQLYTGKTTQGREITLNPQCIESVERDDDGKAVVTMASGEVHILDQSYANVGKELRAMPA